MTLSEIFLFYAQKTIEKGMAYAMWTGIGTVGTLIVGIIFLGDSYSVFKLIAALLIVVGIVGLKIF